jgi:hypothetical protein
MIIFNYDLINRLMFFYLFLMGVVFLGVLFLGLYYENSN